MLEDKLLPQLDLEVLLAEANKSAMRGAIKQIQDYYEGYDSPFKKAIEEQLKKQGLNGSIKLPNIITLINEKMAEEVNKIANNAVAHSFMPLVGKFFTNQDKNVLFSDILRKYIEITDCKEGDVIIEIEEEPQKYNIKYVNIHIKNNEDTDHCWTIQLDWYRSYDVKEMPPLNEIPFSVSIPYKRGLFDDELQMEMISENVKLKMPFRKNMIDNDFLLIFINMQLNNSTLTLDVTDFEEDMFPDEECHC